MAPHTKTTRATRIMQPVLNKDQLSPAWSDVVEVNKLLRPGSAQLHVASVVHLLGDGGKQTCSIPIQLSIVEVGPPDGNGQVLLLNHPASLNLKVSNTATPTSRQLVINSAEMREQAEGRSVLTMQRRQDPEGGDTQILLKVLSKTVHSDDHPPQGAPAPTPAPAVPALEAVLPHNVPPALRAAPQPGPQVLGVLAAPAAAAPAARLGAAELGVRQNEQAVEQEAALSEEEEEEGLRERQLDAAAAAATAAAAIATAAATAATAAAAGAAAYSVRRPPRPPRSQARMGATATPGAAGSSLGAAMETAHETPGMMGGADQRLMHATGYMLDATSVGPFPGAAGGPTGGPPGGSFGDPPASPYGAFGLASPPPAGGARAELLRPGDRPPPGMLPPPGMAAGGPPFGMAPSSGLPPPGAQHQGSYGPPPPGFNQGPPQGAFSGPPRKYNFPPPGLELPPHGSPLHGPPAGFVATNSGGSMSRPPGVGFNPPAGQRPSAPDDLPQGHPPPSVPGGPAAGPASGGPAAAATAAEAAGGGDGLAGHVGAAMEPPLTRLQLLARGPAFVAFNASVPRTMVVGYVEPEAHRAGGRAVAPVAEVAAASRASRLPAAAAAAPLAQQTPPPQPLQARAAGASRQTPVTQQGPVPAATPRTSVAQAASGGQRLLFDASPAAAPATAVAGRAATPALRGAARRAAQPPDQHAGRPSSAPARQ